MKQDRMLMVTMWRREGNGGGATNCGGDRRMVQLQNVERYQF